MNLFSVFMSMLREVGGEFKAFKDEEPRKVHESEEREREWGSRLREVSAEEYLRDTHGQIRRLTPKRDKSISARQWKKQAKARRAEARKAAMGGGVA